MGGGVFGAVMTFSPLYLIERGMVPQSLFFIVYASCAVLVRVLCRNLADRNDKTVVARLCFAVIAVSMFSLGATESILTFSLAAALFGLGHGQMFPTMAAHSAEVVPGGHVRAMTLWSGGFILGISAGSWFAGLLAELYAIGAAIQLSGILPLVAFVAIGRSKRAGGRLTPKVNGLAK
jgi:predicted MFS family arabinose efflux permease